MAKIITPALVEEAISLLAPSIRTILEGKDYNWGPKWVSIAFSGPQEIYVEMTVGYPVEWDPEWGEEKDFATVARDKHDLSKRERKSGSEILYLEPWRYREGDWLYSGSAYKGGLTCGVSGAKGEVDEMIANLVLDTIMGLCILRRRFLQEVGVKQISA